MCFVFSFFVWFFIHVLFAPIRFESRFVSLGRISLSPVVYNFVDSTSSSCLCARLRVMLLPSRDALSHASGLQWQVCGCRKRTRGGICIHVVPILAFIIE